MKTKLTLLITETKIRITCGENSGRRIFRKANIPVVKFSVGQIFHASKKFPCGGITGGKISPGEFT